jgi:hypothetical protein
MVPAPTKDDNEFIADLARFAEALVSEADIKRKYRFDDEVWTSLGGDDELVRAIEAEKVRRIRDGSSKREKAQLLVVKAPDVLGNIMLDAGASPRHRVDAAKALDGFAANGPGQGAPAADRFVITINLGTDADGKPVIEHYDKPLAPMIALDASEADPHTNPTTNASAAKRPTGGGDGQPL